MLDQVRFWSELCPDIIDADDDAEDMNDLRIYGDFMC